MVNYYLINFSFRCKGGPVFIALLHLWCKSHFNFSLTLTFAINQMNGLFHIITSSLAAAASVTNRSKAVAMCTHKEERVPLYMRPLQNLKV